jgi:hypothetical protein
VRLLTPVPVPEPYPKLKGTFHNWSFRTFSHRPSPSASQTMRLLRFLPAECSAGPEPMAEAPALDSRRWLKWPRVTFVGLGWRGDYFTRRATFFTAPAFRQFPGGASNLYSLASQIAFIMGWSHSPAHAWRTRSQWRARTTISSTWLLLNHILALITFSPTGEASRGSSRASLIVLVSTCRRVIARASRSTRRSMFCIVRQ